MKVLLFGDQTAEPDLRQTVCAKSESLAASFLKNAFRAIREENTFLPRRQRCEELSRSSSLEELLSLSSNGCSRNPALGSSVHVLAQIASILLAADSGSFRLPAPFIPATGTPAPATHLIGICTGLLSAAAIASFQSTSTWSPLAVEIVRIAFRVGTSVRSLAQDIEGDGTNDNWATVVSGISQGQAQEAVDALQQDSGLTAANGMYISAVGSNSVTISGPPSTRHQLWQKSTFEDRSRLEVPIYGPFHAGHLYDESHVDKVLTFKTKAILAQYTPQAIVFSAETGLPFPAGTTLDLVTLCLKEIFTKVVRWDIVLQNLPRTLLDADASSCDVFTIGRTNSGNSVLSALRSAGVPNATLYSHDSAKARDLVSNRQSSLDDGSKIAVVGMSGRFPNANGLEAFWHLLELGLDVHREVPKDRFDAEAHTDVTGRGKNKSHTPYGCFIDEPGLFDPRFFNMSPKEAMNTDPMQRLVLTTAYEAMENAGFVVNRSPSTQAERVGTFYGQTSDDWREVNSSQDISLQFITGGIRAFGPGRLNYHFKFSGPSYSVDTACSSSLVAIQLACTSLLSRQCDTAFAGGMNIMTNPDFYAGLSKGQFLSKTGSCKTFDHDADGYCRGDGVATVILKRLEDARADNDPILGVILSSATNHSSEAVSITHPHAGAQEFLFRKIMRESGVEPREVDFLEMHGTGTQAGDGVEMKSVTNVFAPENARKSNRPLFLSSVKANIGHGEASSGVSALIKVLLMLKMNKIPPHCGIKDKMNKGFPNLTKRNVHIARQTTPFPRPADGRRLVFVNNFSAAGGNTALLLEDAPEASLSRTTSDARLHHAVTISAKSLKALKMNMRSMIAYLEKNPDGSLSDLSYTTSSRRLHFPYRLAVTASKINQVREELFIAVEETTHSPVGTIPPRVIYVFTGQGSAYCSLGKVLWTQSRQYRDELNSLDSMAQAQGFSSFLPLIDGSVDDVGLLSPVATQLGLVCTQIALAHLWQSWGVQLDAVVGHSLGEFSALCIAGTLSASQTINVVGRRASLLEEHCTKNSHKMLAVQASVEDVRAVIQDPSVEVACLNGPSDTVLSGLETSIRSAAQELAAHGLRSTQVNVPFAFHSSQVDSILDPFRRAIRAIEFKRPKIPVISPLLSSVISETSDQTLCSEYLVRLCREPVNFIGGVESAVHDGHISTNTIFLEIGPHPVCSKMIKSILGPKTVVVPSLRRKEDPWKTVISSLAVLYTEGISIDWAEYHREFEAAHQVLSLPNYAFDEKVYWIDYKNNWCLTKGDRPTNHTFRNRLCTTTIQKILQEDVTESTVRITAETDLSEPALHSAICGHLVNGAGLCPSSIYADMAFTLADYAWKLMRPGEKSTAMNICKMETFKPLLLKNTQQPEHQDIQIELSLNVDSCSGDILFYTPASSAASKAEHAKCVVKFEDATKWKQEWQEATPGAQHLIRQLRQNMLDGKAHKILKGLAYRLFAVLVDYSEGFQGMEEVILDSDRLEATARIKVPAARVHKSENFFISPYFIDSIAHIAGFVVNGAQALATSVYISHGWESMRFGRSIDTAKTYQTYVQMKPTGEGKMVAGDVYLFDGDEMLGFIGGLKFQCIPRNVLDTLLPMSHSKAFPSRGIVEPLQNRRGSKPGSALLQNKTPTTFPKPLVRFAEDSTAVRALDIIRDELGVDSADLVDKAEWTLLGVDSLVCLSLVGKFREDLHLEVANTLFNDFSTVKALKDYLLHFGGSEASPSNSVFTATTPELIHTSSPSTDRSRRSSTDFTLADDEVIPIIRSSIAEEMGLDLHEIAPTTNLAHIGMDSIMQLSLLSSLREKLRRPLSAGFLADHPSLLEMETALGILKQPREHEETAIKIMPSPIKLAGKSFSSSATSVLLQGNSTTATRTIFLLPDGSGSATSYIHLPPLHPLSIAVYGLNCPFLRTPELYTMPLASVAEIYIIELRRRQPQGPYILGGWSAGGVYAYEIARQLIEVGEMVDHLILVDAPCPLRLAPTPLGLHDFFNEIGLLGTGNPQDTPMWLLEHFAASVKALGGYKPVPLPKDHKVKTLVIWAEHGVAKFPGDRRPELMSNSGNAEQVPNSVHWIIENRTEFGGNGWDELLLGMDLTCASVEGNHFSMMKAPGVDEVARLIRSQLA